MFHVHALEEILDYDGSVIPVNGAANSPALTLQKLVKTVMENQAMDGSNPSFDERLTLALLGKRFFRPDPWVELTREESVLIEQRSAITIPSNLMTLALHEIFDRQGGPDALPRSAFPGEAEPSDVAGAVDAVDTD